MATLYQTDLKQDKDGCYYRWLGENEKSIKQKFRLGRSKPEAKRRLKLIVALYETQDQDASAFGGTWLPDFLDAAKLIAKGRPAVLPRLRFRINDSQTVEQSAETYAKQLILLNLEGFDFQPEDSTVISDVVGLIDTRQRSDRFAKAKLAGTNPDRDPTGQTITEAIDAFIDHLKSQFTSPDGKLEPWGKTQVVQVESWRRFMAEAATQKDGANQSLKLLETDLSDVTVARAQQMIDTIRKRPLTFESKKKKRLAVKSAQSINKKIKHFFDWLDLSDDWHWWEPSRFRKLDYSVAKLSDAEKHSGKLNKEQWRISDKEIRILVEYATSPEYVLLLLGLNCAFGAGEIGNLRIPYVKLDSNQIDGIRFKTSTDSRHYLWNETVDALRWELDRRASFPKNDASEDIVFLTEKDGSPLWRKTKEGNYSNGVTKRWLDLTNRIRKDHPDFPKYSFGKLRKTAAIRVLEIADAESASMILSHGIPTDDKLLSAYVNIPWEKLYETQEVYGETVRSLICRERPLNEKPPKNYIGKKAKAIVDRFQNGENAPKIAEALGLSVMTVYRHLDRAGLRAGREKQDKITT